VLDNDGAIGLGLLGHEEVVWERVRGKSCVLAGRAVGDSTTTASRLNLHLRRRTPSNPARLLHPKPLRLNWPREHPRPGVQQRPQRNKVRRGAAQGGRASPRGWRSLWRKRRCPRGPCHCGRRRRCPPGRASPRGGR
jgi:hypothetical protein